MSSSESEPRSPASAVSSLTSADLDSPMSPDGEFSQDFPLVGADHGPDETVPAPGEPARFRGRVKQAAEQVQGGPHSPLAVLGVAPLQPNPAPQPPQGPAPEGIPIIHPVPRRGAAQPVAMGNTLPGPPLTPRALTPENN